MSNEPKGPMADADAATPESAAFTQGPWVAFERLNSHSLYSMGNEGSLLAVFHSHSGGGQHNISPATRAANARLAAAAPDMLAALKSLRDGGEYAHSANETYRRVAIMDAAIDKATRAQTAEKSLGITKSIIPNGLGDVKL